MSYALSKNFVALVAFCFFHHRISNFLTAAEKLCCSTKEIRLLCLLLLFLSLFFISRSSSLSLYFSLSFASLSPTFSVSQILGRDSQSKLNTLDNTDTETISVFRLVVIDCFIISALQDAGGHAISRQKNLELHLGCHTC